MMVKHYGANAVEVDGVLFSNAFRQSHGMGKITKSEWYGMEVENV